MQKTIAPVGLGNRKSRPVTNVFTKKKLKKETIKPENLVRNPNGNFSPSFDNLPWPTRHTKKEERPQQQQRKKNTTEKGTK